MGEEHEPESHIIPNIMKSLLNKQSFKLFGEDYKTTDGTCVRDYIHVLDLVESHVLAIEKINKAFASFDENKRGSITEGKDADIIVVEDDLFLIERDEIKNSKIEMTYLNGNRVFWCFD